MLNIKDYFCKIEIFSGLSQESKALLEQICRLQKIKARTQLFWEGDEGQSVFFLVNGSVQLSKLSAEGKEVVIKLINPGELFAEVILFEKSSYPVNAVAIVDSQVLSIPKAGMLQLLEKQDFRNDFISALMKKQRYLKERIHFLTACSVEERFKLFLRQQYGQQHKISIELSKKEVASVLGVTPESLSRLLLKLQERGLLQWSGREITIERGYWQSE